MRHRTLMRRATNRRTLRRRRVSNKRTRTSRKSYKGGFDYINEDNLEKYNTGKYTFQVKQNNSKIYEGPYDNRLTEWVRNKEYTILAM